MEGVAWFWKFKCEHRLLMFLVKDAIDKAGEQRLVSRKEREGLQGEEEREPEPTPAYPGLELSVQAQLAELLHRAEDIWCGGGPQFRPSDWCGPRTMCQLLLAAALHLKLLGHSAPRLLRLVARLGREHGSCEEEVLVALAELAAAGDEVDVEAVLALGRGMKETKPLRGLAGVTLSLVLGRRGDICGASNILQEMMELEGLKQNTIEASLVKSRVLGDLSRLKLHVGYRDVEDQGLVGPLELAIFSHESAKLACWWLDENVRIPHMQDPSLLWKGPYADSLQLEQVAHLESLYRTTSSIWELRRCAIHGLKMAQENCLALRTAEQLVSLASVNLLCEDEAAAEVNLRGAQFVLEDVMGSSGPSNKVRILEIEFRSGITQNIILFIFIIVQCLHYIHINMSP